VKKRKRKLSEAQRLALVRRVLQRSAKDILYMGKIARNKDDPRAAAKYLSAELFACPTRGGALVRPDNRVRWNEQGFVRSKAAAANRFMDESFMFLPDEPIARRFSDNFGHENCVILCENSKATFWPIRR
jgi:hypothetical protein